MDHHESHCRRRWLLIWTMGDGVDRTAPVRITSAGAALHVVGVVSLRAPFVVQPIVIGNEHCIQTEIKRLETRGKKVATETKTFLASLHLKGRVVTERGTITTSILRRATGRDRMVILGSRGLDALDRFMLGVCPLRRHCMRPVLFWS